MTEAVKKNQEGRSMWSLSLPTATLWFDIANIALVLSLVVGVISTFTIVRTGRIKETYLRRELAATALAAAEANARAAEASLELAKFKAPRVLAPPQMEALAVAMSSFKGQRVSLAASPATFETAALMRQIGEALKGAGINADENQGAALMHVGIVRGVVAMATRGNAKGEQFAAAFARAMNELGIPTTWANGKMEDVIQKMEKDQPNIRSDEYHSWVIIVVGDKQ